MDESKLRNVALKLYAYDVTVYSDYGGENLVENARDSDSITKLLDDLTPLRKHLFVKLFEKLAPIVKPKPKASYMIGEMDPEELLTATDYFDFFNLLLQGYHDYKERAAGYILPMRLNQFFRQNPETERMAELGSIFEGITGAKMPPEAYADASSKELKVEKPKDSQAEHFQLLCILRDDFMATGDPISYPALKLIRPHIENLLNKRFEDRRKVLSKMVNGQYPYHDPNNQSDWQFNIGGNE